MAFEMLPFHNKGSISHMDFGIGEEKKHNHPNKSILDGYQQQTLDLDLECSSYQHLRSLPA